MRKTAFTTHKIISIISVIQRKSSFLYYGWLWLSHPEILLFYHLSNFINTGSSGLTPWSISNDANSHDNLSPLCS